MLTRFAPAPTGRLHLGHLRQGIDLVIRGEDLLPSTGRQIRLARLLGRERPPAFRHHPLIMKTADQKVSKSDGDTGIRELRARGWTPEQVKAAARSRGSRLAPRTSSLQPPASSPGRIIDPL